MIKKTGDQYTVYSETGKRLSKPSSKKSAKKRLQQIEYFKHQDMDKSYENSQDLESHEKGAKKRFKKIKDATVNIQQTLKELTAADEALTKAIEKETIGEEAVGKQDVSASKKTLETDTLKGERADRVELSAYKDSKHPLRKAADDPSYTVEMRDGIGDRDRYLMEKKRKKEELRKNRYGHWIKKSH